MGALGNDGLAVPGRVDLAHEPPFVLGNLRFDPPTRQAIHSDQRQTIEPKVMQVLVALFRARGAVVSRDELIAWCWDGRIVGDDAINRVIARIRALASGLAEDSFQVETIARVGYRLLESGPKTNSQPKRDREAPVAGKSSKRQFLIAAGLLGTVAATGGVAVLVQRGRQHTPPPEAQELYRRGELAWKSALGDQVRQSVRFFERAVQIDPQYGQAWGALAVTYTHFLEGYDQAEVAALPAQIRAAAKRALDLDPDNADAQLALSNIRPNFRNWAQSEREMRGICERHPEHWLSHARLAVLLYQVGRLREGIKFHSRVLEIDRMVPLTHAFIIRALSNLGEIQEAEAAIRRAKQIWPSHPALWETEYFHLLFSGQPQAATALVMDPRSRPSGMDKRDIDESLTLAGAIEYRRPADVDKIVEPMREGAMRMIRAVSFVAPVFAALGRLDLVYDSLQRYYLDRGTFGPPAPLGPAPRRNTDLLFSTPVLPLLGEPRGAQMLADIGLERYWRRTGTVPDFRGR